MGFPWRYNRDYLPLGKTSMTREDLWQELSSRIQSCNWHFFQYHVRKVLGGGRVQLIDSMIEALFVIESAMTGAGRDYINKIVSFSNKANHTPHYDQLLQVLAEMLVVQHAVSYGWANLKGHVYEPVQTGSAKNPEIVVSLADLSVGVEVKAPEFVKKHNERGTKPQQVATRTDILKLLDKDQTMLPRDNPVKDFLISANAKFASFKAADPNFYGLLVIVWDDFIYEPISALVGQPAGLFTKGSFAHDERGQILKFENVDCVILTRHLLPIRRGTIEEPMPDLSRHPLDYGRQGEFPFKVYFKNPNSTNEVPEQILRCFQTIENGQMLGAEYMPQDFIQWFNS